VGVCPSLALGRLRAAIDFSDQFGAWNSSFAPAGVGFLLSLQPEGEKKRAARQPASFRDRQSTGEMPLASFPPFSAILGHSQAAVCRPQNSAARPQVSMGAKCICCTRSSATSLAQVAIPFAPHTCAPAACMASSLWRRLFVSSVLPFCPHMIIRRLPSCSALQCTNIIARRPIATIATIATIANN